MSTQSLSLAKRALFGLLLTISTLCLAVAVTEWAYRSQWVDTYHPELLSFNPPEVLESGETERTTVLALGDSYTAGRISYPNLLRKMMPDHRIINGGLSGSGIVQANIVAQSRLKQFKPDICIYQIYVGNDLFDIRYPWRGNSLGIARRVYWFLATYFRSIGFINYRLGQNRAGSLAEYTTELPVNVGNDSFSLERYDQRERLYFSAEPEILDNHIFVTDERAKEYRTLLKGMTQLHKACEVAGAKLVVVVIPHAVQVSGIYVERMRSLGAQFKMPDLLEREEYPFLAGIQYLFSNAEDVKVVDVRPALRKREASGASVYFANDGHLNPTGQECVVSEIVDALNTGGAR